LEERISIRQSGNDSGEQIQPQERRQLLDEDQAVSALTFVDLENLIRRNEYFEVASEMAVKLPQLNFQPSGNSAIAFSPAQALVAKTMVNHRDQEKSRMIFTANVLTTLRRRPCSNSPSGDGWP
jgi:hypothetical protein